MNDAQDPTTREQDAPEAEVDAQQAARDAQRVADDVVARVLARAGTAVHDGGTVHTTHDGEQLDLEERTSLRRVAGLSTELQDVTEVEYRQLRLERVVLVGLWGPLGTTQLSAEISLRELAALAETAGSEVLDGLLQRRQNPDPGSAPARRRSSRAWWRRSARTRWSSTASSPRPSAARWRTWCGSRSWTGRR